MRPEVVHRADVGVEASAVAADDGKVVRQVAAEVELEKRWEGLLCGEVLVRVRVMVRVGVRGRGRGRVRGRGRGRGRGKGKG